MLLVDGPSTYSADSLPPSVTNVDVGRSLAPRTGAKMGLVSVLKFNLAGIYDEGQHSARLLHVDMQTYQANMFKRLVSALFWLELFRISISMSKRLKAERIMSAASGFGLP